MTQIRRLIVGAVFIVAGLLLTGTQSSSGPSSDAGIGASAPNSVARELRNAMVARDAESTQPLEAQSATACVGGMAGIYPCDKVDLQSFLPMNSIGGGQGNDIWGWTDPQDGSEYALMGRSSGTSFVDISDPENPIYLGNLPTHTSNSSWRDIKVYADHAFIVSAANGHGMQVFDLTELRNVVSPPVTFSETAHYGSFGYGHNLAINEDSGYAYAVGTNSCSGGLHMVDIQTPTTPVFAGCVSSDGYVHDSQCVIYHGPDLGHQGDEICFNYNENTLTIVDVSNKNNPAQLSRTGYTGSAYTHQGWVTDNHLYLLLGDEVDEGNFGHNTRTRVFDISNLELPQLVGYHDSTKPAIDHNQYIVGSRTYQANYRAGLQIYDISDVANANFTEVGFFDVYPNNDNANYNGTWSVYPFFESGSVILSGIEQGLFVVRPHESADPPVIGLDASPNPVRTGEPFSLRYSLENPGPEIDTLVYLGVINNQGVSTVFIVPVTIPSGLSIIDQPLLAFNYPDLPHSYWLLALYDQQTLELLDFDYELVLKTAQ